PDGAKVALTDAGFHAQFQRCASKKFVLFFERAVNSQISPDYSVIPTRYDDDLDYFRGMPVINTIGRGKTGFVVVKKAPQPQ
ncbi:MAG TPA: hypothetical protein VF518_16020, partial [Polyangia bacterium]